LTARHWLRRRPWLYLWLPLVAWMGLIFYLSAQPDLPQPRMGWADLLLSNGAHAFVFGVLAILWARALADRPRSWAIAFVLTMLYALSDEVHQAFVPGRHPDLFDLMFDGIGAMLALGLWAWWLRFERERR